VASALTRYYAASFLLVGIRYKIPVTSRDELKLRIFAAIETVIPQMLENSWREIEYRLDTLRVMKGAYVEVAWHSAALIL
jgi:hypothetical protein